MLLRLDLQSKATIYPKVFFSSLYRTQRLLLARLLLASKSKTCSSKILLFLPSSQLAPSLVTRFTLSTVVRVQTVLRILIQSLLYVNSLATMCVSFCVNRTNGFNSTADSSAMMTRTVTSTLPRRTSALSALVVI